LETFWTGNGGERIWCAGRGARREGARAKIFTKWLAASRPRGVEKAFDAQAGDARMARLDFWYDFASTYSYLAAIRCHGLAETAGVALNWRPFLLGPIFAAQGWTTSPFNLYPAKGRYMLRDLERLCAQRGLEFRAPDPFPQNSLLAARLALAVPEALRPDFSRAVFLAEFGEGRTISDEVLLGEILARLGLNAAETFDKARSDAVRAHLRAETETAQKIGLFGAPSFVAGDGEIFWGDDRLEQALAWAKGVRNP
jgi:2-hydroxychromene-2-carboxylate isomerase